MDKIYMDEGSTEDYRDYYYVTNETGYTMDNSSGNACFPAYNHGLYLAGMFSSTMSIVLLIIIIILMYRKKGHHSNIDYWMACLAAAFSTWAFAAILEANVKQNICNVTRFLFFVTDFFAELIHVGMALDKYFATRRDIKVKRSHVKLYILLTALIAVIAGLLESLLLITVDGDLSAGENTYFCFSATSTGGQLIHFSIFLVLYVVASIVVISTQLCAILKIIKTKIKGKEKLMLHMILVLSLYVLFNVCLGIPGMVYKLLTIDQYNCLTKEWQRYYSLFLSLPVLIFFMTILYSSQHCQNILKKNLADFGKSVQKTNRSATGLLVKPTALFSSLSVNSTAEK